MNDGSKRPTSQDNQGTSCSFKKAKYTDDESASSSPEQPVDVLANLQQGLKNVFSAISNSPKKTKKTHSQILLDLQEVLLGFQDFCFNDDHRQGIDIYGMYTSLLKSSARKFHPSSSCTLETKKMLLVCINKLLKNAIGILMATSTVQRPLELCSFVDPDILVSLLLTIVNDQAFVALAFVPGDGTSMDGTSTSVVGEFLTLFVVYCAIGHRAGTYRMDPFHQFRAKHVRRHQAQEFLRALRVMFGHLRSWVWRDFQSFVLSVLPLNEEESPPQKQGVLELQLISLFYFSGLFNLLRNKLTDNSQQAVLMYDCTVPFTMVVKIFRRLLQEAQTPEQKETRWGLFREMWGLFKVEVFDLEHPETVNLPVDGKFIRYLLMWQNLLELCREKKPIVTKMTFELLLSRILVVVVLNVMNEVRNTQDKNKGDLEPGILSRAMRHSGYLQIYSVDTPPNTTATNVTVLSIVNKLLSSLSLLERRPSQTNLTLDVAVKCADFVNGRLNMSYSLSQNQNLDFFFRCWRNLLINLLDGLPCDSDLDSDADADADADSDSDSHHLTRFFFKFFLLVSPFGGPERVDYSSFCSDSWRWSTSLEVQESRELTHMMGHCMFVFCVLQSLGSVRLRRLSGILGEGLMQSLGNFQPLELPFLFFGQHTPLENGSSQETEVSPDDRPTRPVAPTAPTARGDHDIFALFRLFFTYVFGHTWNGGVPEFKNFFRLTADSGFFPLEFWQNLVLKFPYSFWNLLRLGKLSDNVVKGITTVFKEGIVFGRHVGGGHDWELTRPSTRLDLCSLWRVFSQFMTKFEVPENNADFLKRLYTGLPLARFLGYLFQGTDMDTVLQKLFFFLFGHPVHNIAHINNGRYGHKNSWVHGANTIHDKHFVGLRFAQPCHLQSIALGRDNTCTFADRCGWVDLEYTTDPEVSQHTTNWLPLNKVQTVQESKTYPCSNQYATGVRAVVQEGMCLDHLQVFGSATQQLGQPLDVSATATPFASDTAGGPSRPLKELGDRFPPDVSAIILGYTVSLGRYHELLYFFHVCLKATFQTEK